MKIYKFSIKNKEYAELPAVYFQEEKTGQVVIQLFEKMVSPEKIVWQKEIIEVLSHDEAIEELKFLSEESSLNHN